MLARIQQLIVVLIVSLSVGGTRAGCELGFAGARRCGAAARRWRLRGRAGARVLRCCVLIRSNDSPDRPRIGQFLRPGSIEVTGRAAGIPLAAAVSLAAVAGLVCRATRRSSRRRSRARLLLQSRSLESLDAPTCAGKRPVRGGDPRAAVRLDRPTIVETIDAAVARLERATGMAPVLVGHSMGGLAMRAWLGATRTRALPPHRHHRHAARGTWLARHARGRNGAEMRHRERLARSPGASEATTARTPVHVLLGPLRQHRLPVPRRDPAGRRQPPSRRNAARRDGLPSRRVLERSAAAAVHRPPMPATRRSISRQQLQRRVGERLSSVGDLAEVVGQRGVVPAARRVPRQPRGQGDDPGAGCPPTRLPPSTRRSAPAAATPRPAPAAGRRARR